MEYPYDGPNETLDFEIQTDILTLLENVRCQNGNELNQEQAFLALASIFNSQEEAQNYFHDAGGLNEIVKILTDGSCQLHKCSSAIFCLACAVKDNVKSQNAILSREFLTAIHQLLKNNKISQKLSKCVAFLIACMVSGSGKGQLLASETGCVTDLLEFFRSLHILISG